MTHPLEVYKCQVCGIVVEVTEGGAGEPVCCGQPMVLMDEKTADSSTEKHVPYVEHVADGVLVKVGQNQPHPMQDKHWIQWIEVLTDDGKVYRQNLVPGDEPQAFFPVSGGKVVAREYCNVHGLWKG